MVRNLAGILVAMAIVFPAPCQPPAKAPEIRTGFYRGNPLTYEVIGGLAIVEGDIVLGTAAELEAGRESPTLKEGVRESSVIAGSRYLWPRGAVPYVVDADLPRAGRVAQAVEYWNDRTPIRLVPRTDESNYVRFFRNNSGPCSSSVGMRGGEQKINTPDDCNAGGLAHEIGHTIGLFHTQSRQDRDFYIKVLWENVDKRYAYNYNQHISDGEDRGPYDYGSLMHYSATGFTRNGAPTMETIPPGIPIGLRDALSSADLDTVRRVYGQPPGATTISTHPAELEIIVDGATYTAPASFTWASGTTHALSAPSPQGSGSTRYVFGRWSDDGEQSHAITASASDTVFVASFVRQYLLKTGASPAEGGTATVSPGSPDGYYAEASAVEVAAVPNPDYAFSNWTGRGYFSTHGYARNPARFLVRAPDINYTAGFTRSTLTTITTDPPALRVTVDGTSYTVPRNFTWPAGSTHTLSVVMPQTAGGGTVRYLFKEWSSGAPETHTITAGETPWTHTARFKVQNLLTADATPASAGSVIVVPASADGFYDTRTAVQLTAAAAGAYKFAYWTGDLAGTAPSQPLVVNDQVMATASFAIPRRISWATTLSAASFVPGPVAPGEIIAIFGLDIGPPTPAWFQLTPAGRVPTSLAGTTVLFDGRAAPVLYASGGQVTAIVPYFVAGNASTRMSIESAGQSTNTVVLPVAAAAPALFTLDSSGRGQGAILNEDGSVNRPSNPAARGSVVVLFGTGEGQTAPPGVDGLIATAVFPRPLLPVKVHIGGRNAPVIYAGAAPTLVAGVLQVNAWVPSDAPVGDAVPVVLTAGEASGPRTVTVAVR